MGSSCPFTGDVTLKILIVDDAEEIRLLVEHFLQAAGYETLCAETGKQALDKLASENPAIAFLDFSLPDMTGLDIMQQALAHQSDCIFIFITAHGSIENAVAAMKMGAFDYLTKPLNAEEITITAQRAKEKWNLVAQNQFLKNQLSQITTAQIFMTNNADTQKVINQAQVVAKTDATILITGESGTGKEVLAQHIHNNSLRANRSFVAVNCSALSEQLLESELFGHVKGAFTGANQNHSGYFEVAEEGTIFLDEIGEVTPQIQVKLLNFLQDKTFSRVGTTQKNKADVRIIAATNRDMKMAVQQGNIREDFFYRLNVFNFHLSPLRERQEDIVVYFDLFVREFAHKMKKSPPTFGEDIKHILLGYTWPGNIRELRNIAERVTILCQTKNLTADLFPEEIASSGTTLLTGDFKTSRKAFEIQYITRHLHLNKGNMAATARQIGLHPVALRKKVAQLDIDSAAIRNQFA